MDLFFMLEGIDHAAQQFWDAMNHHRVFAFHGSLGSGKTTFITTLCQVIGVVDKPSSPTFSIINEYEFQNRDDKPRCLYHLDVYRIDDEEEAIYAGIEECLLSPSICFVEWAEKIPNLLPEDTVHVYLSLEEKGRRLHTSH